MKMTLWRWRVNIIIISVKMGREDSTYQSQSHHPQSLPVIEVKTNVHVFPDKCVLSRGKEGVGSRRRKYQGSVEDGRMDESRWTL